MNILLCTVGASWAVIPEVFGFIDPDQLDLYRHHPERESLDRLRFDHDIPPPDELWLCTTEGRQTSESLAIVHEWWRVIGEPMPLRVWRAAGTDQLANQVECNHIRELILRVVLRAAETVHKTTPSGKLVLSLAGGRKTMSADLQSAGSLFGADAWLHIVGPDPLPAEIARDASPERFASSLLPNLAGAVTPLIVGKGRRDELLDVEMEGGAIISERFPVPDANSECLWSLPPKGAELSAEINNRQRQGSQLFGNFLADIADSERHENWRSLYRLPPADITELRNAKLGNDMHRDRDWLQKLPKGDLHRHIGGCLDLPAQCTVGEAIWATLTTTERDIALKTIRPLIESQGDWPWQWPEILREKGMSPRSHLTAALLTNTDISVLEHNLWSVTEPRLGLKERTGFSSYERPGELTGSAVLTHQAALEPYASALVKQAIAEGLVYVELRGSPHKYREEDPATFVVELHDALMRALSNAGQLTIPIEFRFVWILDRRQRDAMEGIVCQAVETMERTSGFLVGIDLAGDEGTSRPEELAPKFEPAFRACLPITIHAGEGECAANIWEATYRLHADRIGHGLTLLDDKRLLTRFRDRGICVELCPTSNREVVGFHDRSIPGSASYRNYPVRELLDSGLPVTIATDNPGISKTTLADEYLVASRMASKPLSRWETLSIVKQAFTYAFLPAGKREKILKRVDAAIYKQLA